MVVELWTPSKNCSSKKPDPLTSAACKSRTRRQTSGGVKGEVDSRAHSARGPLSAKAARGRGLVGAMLGVWSHAHLVMAVTGELFRERGTCSRHDRVLSTGRTAGTEHGSANK